MLAEAEAADPRWPEPVVLRGTVDYRLARLSDDRLEADQAITRGLGHAERALALEGRHPAALELRGTLRYLRWLLNLQPDPGRAAGLLRDAESDLRSAVSAAPARASAWSVLSHLHYQKPDFVEAKLAAQRAYEEDAYLRAAPDIVWRLFTTSYDLEDGAGATQWCREGQRRFPANPRFVKCRLWLMTAPGQHPDIDRGWALTDSLQRLWPGPEWEARRREPVLVVAAVIARVAATDSGRRAGLADSARRVLERARAAPAEDPDGELLGTETFVRTLLGDTDEAIRLLKQYFTLNPGHRERFARGNSWWWRSLQDDPRFAELVGFSGG